jgi:phosphatidylglycerophosphatase A
MSFGHPIWPRFLPSSVVLSCATLGPVGRAKHAPGTWGSLVGMAYQLIFFHPLSHTVTGQIVSLFLIATGLWFAISICAEAEFRLGKRDPGEVVLDEFVCVPICFLGWNALQVGIFARWPILIALAGFLVFRVFDVLKPFGIRKLQDLPGGLGVVMDDVAAAIATCVVLHVGVWAWMKYLP